MAATPSTPKTIAMYKLIDKVLVEQPKIAKAIKSHPDCVTAEAIYIVVDIEKGHLIIFPDDYGHMSGVAFELFEPIKSYPASEALIATGKVEWQDGEFELREETVMEDIQDYWNRQVAYPLDEVKEEDVWEEIDKAFLRDTGWKKEMFLGLISNNYINYLKQHYNLTRK